MQDLTAPAARTTLTTALVKIAATAAAKMASTRALASAVPAATVRLQEQH